MSQRKLTLLKEILSMAPRRKFIILVLAHMRSVQAVPPHVLEGIVHYANIPLLSMTVDIDLSKTWHHSTETTLDKYLFQQEKWLLIVICYGNLSSAVLVVNKFSYNLFLFAPFQINVRFRLQIQARGVK